MKKIAVFDIDGTLFRWQLYHELVFELKSLGIFSDNEALDLDTALTSWQAKSLTWQKYEDQVIKTIEDNLTSITPATLEQSAKRVIERSGHKVYGYTATLLQQLHADGYYTIAVTASQQEIAEQFARRYDFDDCIAAVYERIDGVYTGKKSRTIYGRKYDVIRQYVQEHDDLTLTDSIAVGDSGGDIALLQLVDHPIAFNPSEDLLAEATTNDWTVVVERKNIAYTLQKGNDGSIVLAKTDAY